MNPKLLLKLLSNIYYLFYYDCIDGQGYFKPNQFDYFFALDPNNTSFSDLEKEIIKEFLSQAKFEKNNNLYRTISISTKSRQLRSSLTNTKEDLFNTFNLVQYKFNITNFYSLRYNIIWNYKQIYT